MPRKKNVLGRYEVANLLFFLGCIVVLGLFLTWVFHYYKNEDERVVRTVPDTGIVSEVVSSATNSCLYYLENKITDSPQMFLSARDIPAGDDGLLKDLFDIAGVSQVKFEEKAIVISKAPKAHWEYIQPTAREVIIEYLSKRQKKP